MKFIEPDDIDLTVEHKHLTDKEKAEVSTFIEQYKANTGTAPTALKVEVTNSKDLDLLINLLQRLNLKWTFSEG